MNWIFSIRSVSYNCIIRQKNIHPRSIKPRYRFVRFKHLVHRATWNLFNRSTHLSLVLDLPVFFVRRHMDGTTSAASGRAHVLWKAEIRVREPLTRTALHSRRYTYIYECVHSRFSSITHYYYERVFTSREHILFINGNYRAHVWCTCDD